MYDLTLSFSNCDGIWPLGEMLLWGYALPVGVTSYRGTDAPTVVEGGRGVSVKNPARG